MERVARADDPSPMQLLDEVERVLAEGGFRAKAKRATATA
jgi:hypothetical protein